MDLLFSVISCGTRASSRASNFPTKMDWIACPLPSCVFQKSIVRLLRSSLWTNYFCGRSDFKFGDRPRRSSGSSDHAVEYLLVLTRHGPEKQKGDLHHALETIDLVDLQDLYANMQEVIQLGEMPRESQATQGNRQKNSIAVVGKSADR